MAIVVRDRELQRKLDAERRRKFGRNGGSLARVLRDIAMEHFIRIDAKAEGEAGKQSAESPPDAQPAASAA